MEPEELRAIRAAVVQANNRKEQRQEGSEQQRGYSRPKEGSVANPSNCKALIDCALPDEGLPYCHWHKHCLKQQHAKFPYMSDNGAPAWWWAGYNSTQEAELAGFIDYSSPKMWEHSATIPTPETPKPATARQPPQPHAGQPRLVSKPKVAPPRKPRTVDEAFTQ